jgi:hypothetical protein
MEMVKWIGEAGAAELAEDLDTNDTNDLESDCHTTKWKSITLAILFGGQKQPPLQLLQEEIDAELELMQALAEVEEDERPDNGVVEIDSDEEFHI